jgi:hypothetical protein
MSASETESVEVLSVENSRRRHRKAPDERHVCVIEALLLLPRWQRSRVFVVSSVFMAALPQRGARS